MGLKVKMFRRLEIYFLIGVIAAIASLLNAECPPASDVPVMCESMNDTFNCARAWIGKGSDEPIEGCNNCIGDYYDGDDICDGEDWNTVDGLSCYLFGSLLVLPGCTFYGFSEHNYTGEVQTFDSGLHSNVQAAVDCALSSTCALGFYSTKCRCEQELVSCEPVDDFDVVLKCDALQSPQEVTCQYTKTIGTHWEDEIKKQFNISARVSAEIQGHFFKLFSANIGVSVNTGYDWTHISIETMSEEVSVQVESSAQPGQLLIIEQAVGHCNGNHAQTELYKFTNSTKAGDIIDVSYKRLKMLHER